LPIAELMDILLILELWAQPRASPGSSFILAAIPRPWSFERSC